MKQKAHVIPCLAAWLAMLVAVTSPLTLTKAKYTGTYADATAQFFLITSRGVVTGSATLAKGWWAIYLRGQRGQTGREGGDTNGGFGDSGAGGVVKGMYYFDADTNVYAATDVGPGPAPSNDAGKGGGATCLWKNSAVRPTTQGDANWIAIAAGGGGGSDDPDGGGGAGGSITAPGSGGKVIAAGNDGAAGSGAAYAGKGANGSGGNGAGGTNYDSPSGFLQGGGGYDGTGLSPNDAGGGGSGYGGGGGGGGAWNKVAGGGGGGSSMTNGMWTLPTGGAYADADAYFAHNISAPADYAASAVVCLIYLGDFGGENIRNPTYW